MDEMKVALNVKEASEFTGIGRSNLRELISKGKIPVIWIGKKILIRKNTLEDFLKLNEGKDIADEEEVIAVWKK